ncbi:MAG: GTPase HflX, partial [Mycobacterium sp.]|nr:GTPase HflX [Mycobacterium sp.]
DGSHPDPVSQINAVHEVLSEIDAASVPEVLVINKVDAADPDVLARLRRACPDAVYVSARTGIGLDRLRDVLDERVPRPQVEVQVVVPYSRGDLVSRVHDDGEVLDSDHTAEGTYLRARVHQPLAVALASFAVAPG